MPAVSQRTCDCVNELALAQKGSWSMYNPSRHSGVHTYNPASHSGVHTYCIQTSAHLWMSWYWRTKASAKQSAYSRLSLQKRSPSSA